MKLNFKPTIKEAFRYLYILLIIMNLLAIFLMISFTNRYVLHTITIDRSTLISEKNVLTGDVDMEKFDKVYAKLLEKKNKNNNPYELNNIFK